MACCLTVPNHYLNLCWLILKGVLWHSPQSNFTRSDNEINCQAWYSPSPELQSYVHLIFIIICIPGNIIFILKQGPGFYSTCKACTALMRFQPYGKWDLVITMNGLWCNKTHTPSYIPNNNIQWTELYNWSCTTITLSNIEIDIAYRTVLNNSL